jgi:hypothetical protein
VNNVFKFIGIILFFPIFLGCTIAGEPRKHWDLQSSKEDMDLSVKKHTSTNAIERQNIEDLQDNLNYKWHINLGNRNESEPHYVPDDKEREKAINQLIDKQLREGSKNNE